MHFVRLFDNKVLLLKPDNTGPGRGSLDDNHNSFLNSHWIPTRELEPAAEFCYNHRQQFTVKIWKSG